MTKYTIDLNGKRYRLNESFRRAIEERAESEYEENQQFSCWWKVNESGNPTLVIETVGVMVPWDDLDQLEAMMPRQDRSDDPRADDEKGEELDAGNGMKTLPPSDKDPDSTTEIFGRSHFMLTPHHFDEMPSPGGDDPEKLPVKPDEVDEEMMVIWLPRHPEIEHTWGAGETIASVHSWVEWDVQKRADQPIPDEEKVNTHDRFESLCNIHGCEVIGEAEPSNDIPETAGQVERKGEQTYENGRFGGGHWEA